MPAKKIKGGKAQAKAQPALPAAGPGGSPPGSAPTLETVRDQNRDHLQALEDALQKIFAHPLFANVVHEPPRKINKDAVANEAGMQALLVKWLLILFEIAGSV